MNELPWHIGLVVVVALLLANALFVAAEFAFVTVRRSRMENMAEGGNAAARRVVKAVRNLDYYIAASQLGITMASIALGAVGEPVLAHLIEPPVETVVGAFAPAVAHTFAIGVAFFLITGLHMVIGEFIPKTIALQEPEKTSLAISGPVAVFSKVFGPAIWVLNQTGNALLRLFGMALRPLQDAPLAAEDIAFSLESSVSAGLISRREFDLARHALGLESTQAREVMVPRSEIAGIPYSADRSAVLRLMAEQRHTGFPVFDTNLDTIVGVVDTKAVLLDENPNGDWRRHIQKAQVLSESASVLDVIKAAKAGDNELVFLIDEYGGTAGLLSFFDVAERLAGSLPEEIELDSPLFHRNPDGTFTMGGQSRLEELEQALGIEFDDDSAQTIGGLVLSGLGKIPAVGESVDVNGHELKVAAMDGHRVGSVVLSPVKSQHDHDHGEGSSHE
ncbi:hemolysin family protein [soil metagenome]